MRKRVTRIGSLRTSPQTGVAMTKGSRAAKRKWVAVLLLYVVLGNWKGYLALFDGNSAEPRQIFPLRIEAMSQEDQDALNGGILIRNERRLQELLQQYLS